MSSSREAFDCMACSNTGLLPNGAGLRCPVCFRSPQRHVPAFPCREDKDAAHFDRIREEDAASELIEVMKANQDLF